MKNIIFSIWKDFKGSQGTHLSNAWREYGDKLVKRQQEYANHCGAAYRMYYIKKQDVNYISLQFLKLIIAEELTQEYDKVLFLDLDVIPRMTGKNNRDTINFFEYHDFSKLLCHKTLAPRWKILRKRLMLESEGISSPHNIINTGVIGMSKPIADMIQFSKREKEINKLFDLGVPESQGSRLLWKESESQNMDLPNNEVTLSYIVEKYKIPCHDIGMAWNFIVDDGYEVSESSCHFLHVSSKKFKQFL
jgi:hypothetical protein